jgi:cell division septum initiation protein DivIVA
VTNRVEDRHIYDELKELRKENKRLKEERDILKKAAAYFAKEAREVCLYQEQPRVLHGDSDVQDDGNLPECLL